MKIYKDQTIDSWTVLELLENKRAKVKCICGHEKILSEKALKDKRPNKSCNRGNCNKNRKFLVKGTIINGLEILDDQVNNRDALFRCKCGKEFIRHKHEVFSGKTRSCGEGLCNVQSRDLTDRVFGNLTAKNIVKDKKGPLFWECICKCGKKISVSSNKLLTGHTKSCGCGKSKYISENHTVSIEDSLLNVIIHRYAKSLPKTKKFLLEEDEIRIFLFSNCFYCGDPPKNIYVKRGVWSSESINYSGIDKIDPSGTYMKENCVPCCKYCNYAKNDLSQKDFIAMAKKIAARFPD